MLSPDSFGVTSWSLFCELVSQAFALQALSSSLNRCFQASRLIEFRRVIRSPDFKNVVFHRMVDMGRCAKCEYYKWKCAQPPQELRGVWQEALSQHHLLQIQQKRCYSADRARAAATYPREELYLALT